MTWITGFQESLVGEKLFLQQPFDSRKEVTLKAKLEVGVSS